LIETIFSHFLALSRNYRLKYSNRHKMDGEIAPIRWKGDEEVMDIDFHPLADVLAVSLISGKVEM
jgi:hypothetical protein